MLIQKVAEMSLRSSARIRILIHVSLTRGRRLHTIAILPVRGRRALAAVILRILLIGPLLVLILRLVLVRSLLVLVLRLLILIRSLLILILPLLILVLALLVGVGARRILDLAGTALLCSRARTILTEPRAHGGTGTEIIAALRIQTGCGQTENEDRSGGPKETQDRSGGRGRRTHSFRVRGPVHKSFSRL